MVRISVLFLCYSEWAVSCLTLAAHFEAYILDRNEKDDTQNRHDCKDRFKRRIFCDLSDFTCEKYIYIYTFDAIETHSFISPSGTFAGCIKFAFKGVTLPIHS